MLDRAEHLKSIQIDRDDLASAIRLAAYFDMHEGEGAHVQWPCAPKAGMAAPPWPGPPLVPLKSSVEREILEGALEGNIPVPPMTR